MSLLFWGLTLGVFGKLLLAIGILKVHLVMEKERRIGDKVIHSFHLEKVLTVVGVLCIVIGYFMEIYFYNGANLLSCHGSDCGANLYSIMVQ